MSFGSKPADIIAVVTFCKALYRKCRDAGGEYDEISREVKALHTVLRHLKYEIEDADSNLNRDHSLWTRQLSPIISSSDSTLKSLSSLLQTYHHRSTSSAESSPTGAYTSWNSEEMDALGTIRVNLISHKKSLTQFLDTLQLAQDGNVVPELDNTQGQLDMILDKVDEVAARMGNLGAIGDEGEVWKQFRLELVREGFANEVLMAHKDVLRAYIREIDQKGLLDVVPQKQTTIAEGGANPERWLQAVRSATTEQRQDIPPTFTSPHVIKEDSGGKERVIGEENMKFPPGMKLIRPSPESRTDSLDDNMMKQLPTPALPRVAVSNAQPHLAPIIVPRLITTNYISPETEPHHLNTDYNSTSSSDSRSPRRRSNSASKPELGSVIRTSELLASSQALTLHPSISPSSQRSSNSFSDDPTRYMAYRPKKQNEPEVQYGSSPISPGGLPVRPRQEATHLAPDNFGNEITADAKWTRISRRLVSPEVLDQDKRRYEARPDFVAVLGRLSRAEIEALALRSQALRDARRRRSSTASENHQGPLQNKMQLPIPIPMPIPTLHPILKKSNSSYNRDRNSKTNESSSGSDSGSSDSEDGGRKRERRERRDRGTEGRNYTYAGSDIGKVSGYPNATGTSPIDPLSEEKIRSPRREASSSHNTRDRDREREHERERARDGRYNDKDHSGNERDRDRDRRRHHSHSNSHSHHHSRSDHVYSHSHSHSHPKTSERERERDRGERTANTKNSAIAMKSPDKELKKQRWKDTLTGAGIGGAAVSLLTVLSEAAEGL